METSDLKKAGSLLSADARIAVCLRLAELERDWDLAAGRAVADRTRPQACGFAADGFRLVVNVSDAAVMQSLRFRKATLERSVARYLRVSRVVVEFRIGSVGKRSLARPARPDHERRAPVILTREDVESEKTALGESGSQNEVAEALARLKAVSDKLTARKKR
jgi:hypothetical protein